MSFEFMSSGEKKKLLVELEERWGIKKLPFLMVETSKDKIRGFSGTMSKEEIKQLSEIMRVEIIGSYLFRREKYGYSRMSMDAPFLLKSFIEKGVLEISEEQSIMWMNGKDLEIKSEPGIYVIKCKEDLMGCGKSDGNILYNYVPKERRLKRN